MRIESMKVDIIVPVYNVEDYLERCINSVLIQTHSNIRLILIVSVPSSTPILHPAFPLYYFYN